MVSTHGENPLIEGVVKEGADSAVFLFLFILF